ncbi:MAG: hypothetical protein OEM28_01175 [Nitrosopumilus sp.]|nr:hypothetical protein [Nitrosopumilus sp.]MDH3486478.1 hypothetical protein [Nitrosopumilus sp.]
MKKRKECGKGYDIRIKDFCFDECFKENIQKRINEATENYAPHTKKISRDES